MDPAQVDVLCCGLATLDLIQYVDHIPGPDEKVVSSDAILDVGGPAANAARTAAALGSATCLVTVLGATAMAETVLRCLLADAVGVVDCRPELRDWQPPIVAITVDGVGRRSVVSAVSAGAPVVAEPPPMPGARVVLLDGHHLDLALAVARAQRDRGAVVVLDGGSWKSGLQRLLPLVDAAVVSADFACPPEHLPLFDAIPHRAVTAGSAPIRVLSAHVASEADPAPPSGRQSVPVPEVAAVDTLGAGDVLHGALCHELARSEVLDPPTFVRALSQAAAVASRSCTERGALGWAHTSD